MNNKLIQMVLVVTVGIIFLGSILAPAISTYGENEKTYTNTGLSFSAPDDDTHILTFNAGTITSDGNVIDTTEAPSGVSNYTVVYAENGFIRYDKTNVMYSCNKSGSSATVVAQFNCTTETVTVTITGDSATISSSDTTVTTRTVDDVLYYLSTEGDYVLATNPYVTADSMMYAGGITVITSPVLTNIYLVWKGTTEDLDGTILATGANFTGATITDMTANTTSIKTNLLKVDSIVINISGTASEETTEVSATYTYFLAPKEVKYDNPDYLGDQYVGLLGAIIVIALASLVVICMRSFTGSRD